ncbi:cell division ATP-binding protein FtsE [Brachybacterium ginsengisoli]|uniref:Cell division ATP-binding protein FtsE n=1 Tax=Brachybacterium ginsengisoli TaxID=1331682 RepID=A0A291GW61_9MICO|nr:cell division ATP-binding protein FtsE [Brachybacterium ginsengisoli]ATG54455.1 cell division ATP-binding protein FtsE [Brachybacterium ginsengisoli]
MIRFDDVTKTYMRGQRPAVENLDIEFTRGEFVFLVGASGSGKSTLMRMVLKEVAPSRGTVYVAGKDLSRIPSWKVPALRRDIGMVFQDFRLLPSKTAYQNIEFALAVIGTPRKVVRRLVPEMLEMVGLEDKGKRLPHELSGGEQQRVAIARAYVNRPSILLADEPTGNLDPATAGGILDLLAEINERGTTVVMATHDRSAVDRMQRRVVEMVGGIVVRDEEQGSYETPAPVSVISGNLPDDSAHRDEHPLDDEMSRDDPEDAGAEGGSTDADRREDEASPVASVRDRDRAETTAPTPSDEDPGETGDPETTGEPEERTEHDGEDHDSADDILEEDLIDEREARQTRDEDDAFAEDPFVDDPFTDETEGDRR